MLLVQSGVMRTPVPLVVKTTMAPPTPWEYKNYHVGQVEPADSKHPQIPLALVPDKVDRTEATISRTVYNDRLKIIMELRDNQGWPIGTLCVLNDNYPVKSWEDTDMWWVDQYLLTECEGESKWKPLLIACSPTDSQEMVYAAADMAELRIVTIDDFDAAMKKPVEDVTY